MKKSVLLFLILIISLFGGLTLPGHSHAASDINTLRDQQSQKRQEISEAQKAPDPLFPRVN